MIQKHSFLSDIFQKYDLFRNIYNFLRNAAIIILPCGAVILVVTVGLSFFVHWHWLSRIIDVITGTSVLFIAYVITLISALDVQVEEDVPNEEYDLLTQEKIRPKYKHSFQYNLTIIWGILLVLACKNRTILGQQNRPY